MGDDFLRIGIHLRVRTNQGGESAFPVELEEGGFEVFALHQVDLLPIDVGTALKTEGPEVRICRACPYLRIPTQRLRRRQPRQSEEKCKELAVEQKDCQETRSRRALAKH